MLFLLSKTSHRASAYRFRLCCRPASAGARACRWSTAFLFFYQDPDPLSSRHEPELLFFSLPFFSSYKLINGYGHVSSNRKFLIFFSSISWAICGNWTRVVFSSAGGPRRAGFVVDNAESTRSSPTWISFPWFLLDGVYISFFVTNV
jgi:hypothetical protein